MITLKPMNKKEYKVFIEKSMHKYAKEIYKSTSTLTKKDARKIAKTQYKRMLKKGFKNPRYEFYMLMNREEKKIGILWLMKEKRLLFVAEIYIRKKYRHQGYGKATLKNVEKIAKKLKIKRTGLNVFYHNVIAKKLYSNVGYDVISEYRIKKI